MLPVKRKSFAIIGAGRFGSSLSITLAEMGHDVLVMDTDETRVQELSDKVTHALQADSTNEQNIKMLGIANFDAVIVAIGTEIQASILTCLMIKELGAKYVVAKALTEQHGKVLERIGVDRVVFPERDMGVRLARQLTNSHVLDCMDLSPEYSVEELLAPDFMAGKSLQELSLRQRYSVNLIAIRSGDALNILPLPADIIKKNDLLIVIGKNKDLAKLEKG